jgi:hypothetical protein
VDGYKQIPVTSSGFPTPLPFVLQQYDQIRFEGNENKVYTIMNVTMMVLMFILY